MIRKILMKRYKVALIILSAFFVVAYSLTSANNVSNWRSEQKYYASEEFQKEFTEHPEFYAKGYDEAKEEVIPYDSLEEFQKDMLTQYKYAQHYYFDYTSSGYTDPAMSDDLDTLIDTSYQMGTYYAGTSMIGAFMVIAALLTGFLLFFIDQKSNFNRFLFSLPISRKKLFSAKLTNLVLPLIGSFAIGIFLHVLIEYLGIPAPYINATFPQLLYSGFSHFLLMVLALCLGIALGTLLGNIIFGPIAVVLAILLLLTFNDLFYVGFADLLSWLFPNIRLLTPRALFILNLGKTSAPWYMLLAVVLASILFIVIAKRIFLHVSMENDGDFLTVPTYKKPMFWTLFLFTSIWGNISLINWYAIANPSFYENFSYHPLPTFLTVTLLCLLASTVLIYFHEIRKWWIERREAKLQTKSY
ncbi:MAG TPA: hypothetical protein H9829_00455 [Candidatus Tetragenococcus pullicola]|nr:hypothetical protein [Candidatus Tetragenococcus pullicola]